jgi:hypothetical protein
MKKLSELATRNRIIQRSLHSIKARMEGRSECSHHVAKRDYISIDANHTETDIGACAFSQDDLSQDQDIPQQLWDDLYDSAFDALVDRSVDVFD